MTVEKKDLDWGNLDFSYRKTDYSYVSNYKDGAWDEGALTTDHSITLSECAGIFHYCQEVFEGLKAYTTADGSIVCFRPDMNAQRMADSAERLVMPAFPQDRFVEAVKQVVEANAAWVPPFGSGATLYVRPLMIATGDVIGVQACRRVPVPHPRDARWARTSRGGDTAVKLCVSGYDRAAPHGTGNIKAGLNYAMSLKAGMDAHAAGYAENLYLDSESRTYVEETGGANVLFVAKDGTLVVPKSHTRLDPALHHRAARSCRLLRTWASPSTSVPLRGLRSPPGAFVECGLCGTAAVISPVGEIHDGETVVVFPGRSRVLRPGHEASARDLTGIQGGQIEDTHGWVCKIC
ncbi:MAG: branched-chain amino acid aminotransferase [Collinsella sp.]